MFPLIVVKNFLIRVPHKTDRWRMVFITSDLHMRNAEKA